MVDIDTIRFALVQVVDLDTLQQLLHYEEVTAHGAWKYARARLRNLRIVVSPTGTTIVGSLAKFLYSTNLAPFDPADIARAFDEIETVLRLPPGTLDEARVTRLDLGINVVVRRSPRLYIRGLVAPPRMQKYLQHETTVGFKHGQRDIAFYDKGAEVKAKGSTPHPHYAGQHVLRCEVRLTRRVARQMRRTVTGADLCDPSFHAHLAAFLYMHLDSVTMERLPVMQPARTVSELRDALALQGLTAAGGLGAVLEIVSSAQASEVIDRHQARKQRDWLLRLNAHPRLAVECDLARELHDAIEEALSDT